MNKMVNEQQRRIRKLLPALQDSLSKRSNRQNRSDADDSNDLRNKYQMYLKCLNTKMPSYLSDVDSLDDFTFFIKVGLLYAEGCGCAENWNDQRLDDLGDYKFTEAATDIVQYLSPLGKRLLLSAAQ